MAKAKNKQIVYGENGYLKTKPDHVKKWAVLVKSPMLDLAFRQEIAKADQAVDQLRNRLNALRFGSTLEIDKVRLITLVLKALDDRLAPPDETE
jgi:hypothetical protein